MGFVFREFTKSIAVKVGELFCIMFKSVYVSKFIWVKLFPYSAIFRAKVRNAAFCRHTRSGKNNGMGRCSQQISDMLHERSLLLTSSVHDASHFLKEKARQR